MGSEIGSGLVLVVSGCLVLWLPEQVESVFSSMLAVTTNAGDEQFWFDSRTCCQMLGMQAKNMTVR